MNKNISLRSINVLIPVKDYHDLKSKAEAQSLKLSDMVRKAIKESLKVSK